MFGILWRNTMTDYMYLKITILIAADYANWLTVLIPAVFTQESLYNETSVEAQYKAVYSRAVFSGKEGDRIFMQNMQFTS